MLNGLLSTACALCGSVDAGTVGRRLRDRAFPQLREAGFTEFKAKTAWRKTGSCVHIVCFAGVPGYMNFTPGTFGTTVAVFYPCVRDRPWRSEAEMEDPPVVRHASLTITKSLRQKGQPRPDLWTVRQDGSDLDDVVDDACAQAVNQGFPWLAELSNLPSALEAFQTRESTEITYRHWGRRWRGIPRDSYSGNLGSLLRAKMVATIALAVGDRATAINCFQQVLDNARYAEDHEILDQLRDHIEFVRALP